MSIADEKVIEKLLNNPKIRWKVNPYIFYSKHLALRNEFMVYSLRRKMNWVNLIFIFLPMWFYIQTNNSNYLYGIIIYPIVLFIQSISVLTFLLLFTLIVGGIILFGLFSEISVFYLLVVLSCYLYNKFILHYLSMLLLQELKTKSEFWFAFVCCNGLYVKNKSSMLEIANSYPEFDEVILPHYYQLTPMFEKNLPNY